MSNFEIDKSLIFDTPLERIPKVLKEQIDIKKPFIDCHTHVFNHNDVPTGYLGIRLPVGRHFLGLLANILHKWKKNTDRDKMSRYAYFLTTMKSRSSEGIFRRMINKYYSEHQNAVFVVLTMDMDPAIKGQSNRSIWTQLAIIAILREQYPTKVLPFVCIDPRRDNALEIFQDAFDKNKHLRYFGLKVYPSLGFLPSHPNLMKMYEVCEEKNIPILTHCSSGSTHGSKRKLDVEGIFVDNDNNWKEGPHRFKAKFLRKKKSYRDYFNRPQHWAPVLDRFKKLNLNIAHFAGDHSWKNYLTRKDNKWIVTIIEFMDSYENVYADFSYTMYSQKHTLKLKEMMQENSKLASRVLFGSDYYMVIIEGNYGEMLERFKNDLGEDFMHQIAVVNPNRHLFGI